MRLRITIATILALIAAAPSPAWSSTAAGTTKAVPPKVKPVQAGPATSGKPGTGKSKTGKVDCAKVKCIALTFDDGPGQQAGKLLDALEKHKAKATFFLEGQYVKARPELVKRIAKEGHQLGNHSYDHPDFTKIDEVEIESQITQTQDLVHKLTGKYPTALRPPFGLADERVETISAELGLPIVLWNTGSRDWASRDEKEIYKEVLGGARRDSVVLMHDWVTQTVGVMPTLLKALKKKGFHVVTVTSLLRGKTLRPGETFPKDASITIDSTPLTNA